MQFDFDGDNGLQQPGSEDESMQQHLTGSDGESGLFHLDLDTDKMERLQELGSGGRREVPEVMRHGQRGPGAENVGLQQGFDDDTNGQQAGFGKLVLVLQRQFGWVGILEFRWQVDLNGMQVLHQVVGYGGT